MALVIKAEKVVVRGDQMIKVLGISGNMKGKHLPTRYLKLQEEGDCCCEVSYDRYVYYNEFNNCRVALLVVGETYPVSSFAEAMTKIKNCGDRLHRIRKQLKEENADWKGEFQVTI